MNSVFRLFDDLTEKIPLTVLLYIRLAAVLIWILIAVVAIYFSWDKGASSAAPSGQDLYMSEIKEKAARERNLASPPAVVVPDLGDLADEAGPAELPSFAETAPSGNRTDLPPYISEKQSPDNTGAYLPEKTGDPEIRRRDRENFAPSGSDTHKSGSDAIQLLPLN